MDSNKWLNEELELSSVSLLQSDVNGFDEDVDGDKRHERANGSTMGNVFNSKRDGRVFFEFGPFVPAVLKDKN